MPSRTSHFSTFRYNKVRCESSILASCYLQLKAWREVMTNLNTCQTAFMLHSNCHSVACVVWERGTKSFISVDGSLIHSLSSWCVIKLFSITAPLFALQYIVKWIPHVVADSIKEGCDLGSRSTPHYKQLTRLQARASLLSHNTSCSLKAGTPSPGSSSASGLGPGSLSQETSTRLAVQLQQPGTPSSFFRRDGNPAKTKGRKKFKMIKQQTVKTVLWRKNIKFRDGLILYVNLLHKISSLF